MGGPLVPALFRMLLQTSEGVLHTQETWNRWGRGVGLFLHLEVCRQGAVIGTGVRAGPQVSWLFVRGFLSHIIAFS